MKFSVLLPTRNGGRYLEYCLRSILDDPYQDMELIVSDNANTDETKNVLGVFKSDKRLKVVTLDKPVCVAENWNRALKASRGDYVLMMGDDDCLLPGYFSRMERTLTKYHNPDCVTYNAYSYVAPQSISGNQSSYYKDPFFNFGPDFTGESLILTEKRLSIVRDMFTFRNRLPLNMQTTLMSRKAMNKIKGGAFQPPFPDHYALNSLLLTVNSWVFLPEKMLVVGVSPKSFGHYVYSDRQDEGKEYLGINSDFKGKLPGIELNNCMYVWLQLLKVNYPQLLSTVEISRVNYVRRQVYSWYLQYRSRAASWRDILRWSGKLSLYDWMCALTIFFDKLSWQRLFFLLANAKKTKVQNLWQGAIPLENISNIKQFSEWITARQKKYEGENGT
jgi:glycosyltransferase involved in cell wall biosynthesis